MTRGLICYQQTGDFHFLTFSCHHRLAYLASAKACALFESALECIHRKFRLAIAGYVVMPEHVHLLVSEPRERDLSSAVRSLKLSVSLRSVERPFWQARYYDFNVCSGDKFTEKLRYIHRNPVARGLVAKPEDWPWSSFRHCATGVKRTVEIESQWTAFRRGNQLPQGVRLQKGEPSCFPTHSVSRNAINRNRPLQAGAIPRSDGLTLCLLGLHDFWKRRKSQEARKGYGSHSSRQT